MTTAQLHRQRDPWIYKWLLALGPVLVALLSAHPYAGSWNDGSRLATVEAVADHGTLRIDRSVFVAVPPALVEQGTPPYPPDARSLLERGTSDKLLIDGHYYSDKPAVISLLLAVPYKLMTLLGLPTFAERPDLAVYLLTLLSSGLCYVVSVWGVDLLARRLGLIAAARYALVASFALGTLALPYVQFVNSHILLMGVMLAVTQLMLPASGNSPAQGWTVGRSLALGTLVGVGYNLDLGLGPVLLASTGGWMLLRRIAPLQIFLVGLSAAPWVATQLLINHALGGVWKPVNTVPEYLDWPGSPFTAANLTGFARHDAAKLAEYAFLLMGGKQGFIGHNLPLFLVLPAMIWVVRAGHPRAPEMAFALVYCLGGWGMYACFSNNYGGACCSIRWFVPFLAPGFYLIAELLRAQPQFRYDLYALGGCGLVMGGLMAYAGPWTLRMVPLYWPVLVAGLAGWGAVAAWRRRRRDGEILSLPAPRPVLARAA